MSGQEGKRRVNVSTVGFSFRCNACKREWDELVTAPIVVGALLRRLHAIVCPSCVKRDVSYFLEEEES